MERAGRLLHKLKASGCVTPEDLARAAWATAVGERIAAHTRAVSLVRCCLTVEVEDSVWQKQLFSLQPHIVKRISEVVGEGVVSELHFRIGVPRRAPGREQGTAAGDEADGIQDPFIRRVYRLSRKKALA